jgi:hypothetical protein
MEKEMVLGDLIKKLKDLQEKYGDEVPVFVWDTLTGSNVSLWEDDIEVLENDGDDYLGDDYKEVDKYLSF